MGSSALSHTYKKIYRTPIHQNITESNWQHGWKQLHSPTKDRQNITKKRLIAGLDTAISRLAISLNRTVYAFTIKQTAYAAIPSSRPTKPIRSEVVALMDTASSSQPMISARHLHIAGMCGLIFGRSAQTVASMFPTR